MTKVIFIQYILLVSMTTCNGQVSSIEINESQKKEIVKLLFTQIDSNLYEPEKFGLVTNEFFLNKPEIAELVPEMNGMYDSLKQMINIFITKNQSKLTYNHTFNESLKHFFDSKNYNKLEFYYYIHFSGFAPYQEDKVLGPLLDSFDLETMSLINRHRPKLYKTINKYIESGYIDNIKDNTTFWHSYILNKDGVKYKQCIVVYFDPMNNEINFSTISEGW